MVSHSYSNYLLPLVCLSPVTAGPKITRGQNKDTGIQSVFVLEMAKSSWQSNGNVELGVTCHKKDVLLRYDGEHKVLPSVNSIPRQPENPKLLHNPVCWNINS